ncbi:MAG: hypothetical protein M3R63_12270 [Actinomycetota bacterium]|nr:hypothetical protein [Actinomycetota bacterium]
MRSNFRDKKPIRKVNTVRAQCAWMLQDHDALFLGAPEALHFDSLEHIAGEHWPVVYDLVSPSAVQ